MKITDIPQDLEPRVGDIIEIEQGEDCFEVRIIGITADGYLCEQDNVQGAVLLEGTALDHSDVADIMPLVEGLRDPKDNPCWKGYHPVGTKKKNGRTVPNCVPNAKESVEEAGPFSYGAKKPRRGSVADLADKKRREQEKNQPPIEPKDQMVGTAKLTKDVSETSDYFRRREREEAIISGQKPARKKQPAQTSDYARRREQEKKAEKGVAEGYTGRETKDGVWRVFKDGKAVAVAGPFKTREEATAWIKKQKQGVAEGSGKNVVKSVKVGNFRHDLVDTGMGWQVRIYNGDELYDTGMSKNSEQKGLAALEDAVAYTEKQTRTKRQGVSEYGTHPSQRVDPRTGKKYVPPKSPLGKGVAEGSQPPVCKHCGKRQGEHQRGKCPKGTKTAVGYTDYGPTKFEPKEPKQQGVAEGSKWRKHPDAYNVDDEGNKTPRNPNSPKFGYDPLQRRADTANDAKTPRGKTAALKTSLKMAKGQKGVAEGSSYETDSMVSHISQIIGNIYPQGGDKNTYMKLVAREMRPIVQSNPKLFRRAFGIAYDRFFHIDHDDDNENNYTDYSMRHGEQGVAEGGHDDQFSLSGRMPATDRIPQDSTQHQDRQLAMGDKIKQQTIAYILNLRPEFERSDLELATTPELIQMLRDIQSGKMTEAEYQGRKVALGKPMAGDVKKSKVYVRKPNGKVVKVNFGDKKMKIKKSNPKRRKSFRARHNCENPGPRWKARYWSCRAW